MALRILRHRHKLDRNHKQRERWTRRGRTSSVQGRHHLSVPLEHRISISVSLRLMAVTVRKIYAHRVLCPRVRSETRTSRPTLARPASFPETRTIYTPTHRRSSPVNRFTLADSSKPKSFSSDRRSSSVGRPSCRQYLPRSTTHPLARRTTYFLPQRSVHTAHRPALAQRMRCRSYVP